MCWELPCFSHGGELQGVQGLAPSAEGTAASARADARPWPAQRGQLFLLAAAHVDRHSAGMVAAQHQHDTSTHVSGLQW